MMLPGAIKVTRSIVIRYCHGMVVRGVQRVIPGRGGGIIYLIIFINQIFSRTVLLFKQTISMNISI